MSYEASVWTEITRTLNSFFDWVHSTNAEDQIFGWAVSSVLIGGGFTLIVKFLRFVLQILRSRVKQRRYYKNEFGDFYLYHPPLILGVSSLPRVAKLIISRGIIRPANAVQMDANNRNFILYEGTATRWKSFMQFEMTSPHGECPKVIITWHFQSHGSKPTRVTFGVMCCTNFHEEPYRVPIILSEEPLSRTAVDTGLEMLATTTTITRELRRRVLEYIKTAPVANDDDEFEHMSSPKGPIKKRTSFWTRFRH